MKNRCEACSKQFSKVSNYNRHLSTCKKNKLVIDKKNKFKCIYCNNNYISNYNLKRHHIICKEKIIYELKEQIKEKNNTIINNNKTLEEFKRKEILYTRKMNKIKLKLYNYDFLFRNACKVNQHIIHNNIKNIDKEINTVVYNNYESSKKEVEKNNKKILDFGDDFTELGYEAINKWYGYTHANEGTLNLAKIMLTNVNGFFIDTLECVDFSRNKYKAMIGGKMTQITTDDIKNRISKFMIERINIFHSFIMSNQTSITFYEFFLNHYKKILDKKGFTNIMQFISAATLNKKRNERAIELKNINKNYYRTGNDIRINNKVLEKKDEQDKESVDENIDDKTFKEEYFKKIDKELDKEIIEECDLDLETDTKKKSKS